LAVFADTNSEFNLPSASRRWLCATINNNQKTDREAAMRQFTMTMIALTAFGAMLVTAQAENQTARASQAFRAATHYYTGSDAWAAHDKVRHPAPRAPQVVQPMPTKRAVDPLYESCEYPWRHLELGCPLGR
jgi:hypothetical protein